MNVLSFNDFTRGLKVAIKPGGTITLEFPHLMRLIEHVHFDTVYHEHFSYFWLYTVGRIFGNAGLRVIDVEELPTRGGSLCVYGAHDNDPRRSTAAVHPMLDAELRFGLESLSIYEAFQERANKVKDELVSFLIERKRVRARVAGYGAAAKWNTLLNYGGIKCDLLPYVCDAALSKQGRSLPGSHIEVLPPAVLRERRPEWVLILPWNIADEVVAQY